ncbi:MAG TPA: protein kinase [Longimicrobiales bacterium]|nr:protein kinase [Longimicrobiales bacterium]
MTGLDRLFTALEDRYRVLRPLGEGGMATVFLAEDGKHHRKVALKVLKAELAAVVGGERFLTEIEITAGMQHPHILPLFDSGESGGFLYYVMPYVEGESLRRRLDREGSLPVADAVAIATGVAEALDYAHRRGVVHRDVKPGNILLVEGKPLVSDFGIALAADLADVRRTGTGVALGTPQYMSPEQILGDAPVGPASDLYSLACVLYEMLVGEPPFRAGTPQAVVGRLLSGSWTPASTERPTVPPNVDAVIRRGLERTPADRFSTGSAMAAALNDPSFRYGEAPTPSAPARSRLTLLAVGAGALVAGLLVGRGLPGEAADEAPVVRYQPTFRYDERPSPAAGATLDLSQDGERLVYVGESATGTQLFVRDRDELISRPVPGTEGALRPALSPDGSRVAFLAPGRALRTIGLDGSQPVTLVDGGVLNFEVSWEPDGYVYFDDVASPGLMRVATTGGASPEAVYRGDRDPDMEVQGAAQLLPGGRALIVTVLSNIGRDFVGVLDLEAGTLTRLVDGTQGRYAPTGHLVYADPDGSLTAHPFDLGRLSLTGEPRVLRELGTGFVDLDLAEDGRLGYSRVPPLENRVVWVDRNGGETRLDDGDPITDARFLSLSPDGTRLAVTTVEEEGRDLGQVWVKDLPQGPYSLLTHEGDVNFRPAWTPDRASLLFISNRSGNRAVWQRRADGSGEAEPVLERELPVDQAALAPDGEWMVYREGAQNGQRAIRARRIGDETSDVPVAGGRFDAFAPVLSPDGRWVAYVSRVNDEIDVYVRPFPTGEGQWRVSRSGGVGPRWAQDGRELFYMGYNDSINVVEATLDGSTPRFGEPRALFSAAPYRQEIFHASYDVTADGERFVMIRLRSQEVDAQEIVVVENFLAELRGASGR